MSESAPICILDDDPSVLRSISRLLDSDGWAARTFAIADDLLAHACANDVPLVVLDVWMPEISGLEVQARLREVAPETKVIIMTGRDDPGIRTSALEGGAVAFFIKPFDDERFLSAVRQTMEEAA